WFLQADDEIIVDDRFHPIPHAGEHALSTGAIDKGSLPIFENLRRPHFERQGAGCGCLRFDTENLYLRLEGFDCAADASDEPATTNAGNDRRRIWCVFQNFKSHCSVTGDEIVIVERMNKCSLRSGKRTFVECFPGHVVWYGD